MVGKDLIMATLFGSGGGSSGSGGGGEGEISPLDALIDGTITEIRSEMVKMIGPHALTGRNYLLKAEFPAVNKIGASAFSNCGKLEDVYTPSASIVNDYAFENCSSLVAISLPDLTNPGVGLFRYCMKLKRVDMGAATAIKGNTFANCYNLVSVIMRAETIATLASTNAFNQCYHILGKVNTTDNPDGLADGYIYVPRALVDTYKAATNWSTYASQFRALEDYTVDGTITGELDPTKI